MKIRATGLHVHFIFQLNQHKKSKLRKRPDHNLLRRQFKARILCKRQSTLNKRDNLTQKQTRAFVQNKQSNSM